MAAPTLIGTSGDTWTTTTGTTRSTGSLSWQTGDIIVVLGITDDNTNTINTPTATGLTFSILSGFPTNTASSCKGYAWSATAGSNGSGAISATVVASMCNIQAYVYRGSAGVGNNAKTASGVADTISLIRGSNNSAVVWAAGDWSATNDTTVASSPVGGTQDQAARDSGGVHATQFAFHWDDQGAAGTTSYGISGFVTAANFTKVAVEITGSAVASFIAKSNSPILQAVNRTSTY